MSEIAARKWFSVVLYFQVAHLRILILNLTHGTQIITVIVYKGISYTVNTKVGPKQTLLLTATDCELTNYYDDVI